MQSERIWQKSCETQLLEVMLKDNMLNDFYMKGCGFVVINESIRSVLQQITHKFPRTNILEIGAGTGATVSLTIAIGIFVPTRANVLRPGAS